MGLIFVTQGHLCQHVVTLLPDPERSPLPNPEKGDFAPFAQPTRKKVTFGPIWVSQKQDKGGFCQALTRIKVTGEQG
jgi:hypothetical protein